MVSKMRSAAAASPVATSTRPRIVRQRRGARGGAGSCAGCGGACGAYGERGKGEVLPVGDDAAAGGAKYGACGASLNTVAGTGAVAGRLA